MSQLIKKKIHELFDSYINGYAFRSNDFNNKRKAGFLPVLKISNVSRIGLTDFSNCHYHTAEGYDKFIAHTGDLAFSLTGSLGYVSIVTEDCLVNQRVLVIKRDKRYSELLDLVQPIIKSLSFSKYCYSKATSESNKNISSKVILDYEIPVYMHENGTVDYEAQRELAQNYLNLEEQKNILLKKAERIKKIKLVEETDYSAFIKVPLNRMVKHHNGNSKYTKEYCQKHKGNIPLYSANNSMPIAYMDTADYKGDYLTYAKNGCAGYITVMHNDFSINGDRSVITFNEKYKDIDLYYLKYYLEPIFRANIKGRMGINGKNEYTKINSTMIKKLDLQIPIPILPDGSFDLTKQKEIAQKYATIESIKQELYIQINRLINIVVE